MRQVARRLKDGSLELVEVPDPHPGEDQVLVRVAASIVSAGTERATMDAAQKNLLAKARARPDQARQVLERVLSEGPRATYEFVRQRLDELGALGYSAAGTVVEAGPRVRGIAAGDRVAIAGGGFANHAELDVVPELLCARVPEAVTDEDAAFATLGAIALHGFRRSEADIGSTVMVIGLGLIGQLAARIALAAGCSVRGVDLDASLVELAASAGVDARLRSAIGPESEGIADAVLICASTDNDDPIELAAQTARDRAPIVVVGAVPMNLQRGPFYGKELDLRLSRSYGPGRYDPEYELHGHDYPIGYVRWTERRNMDAFLNLVAKGLVRPSELITHRFGFDEAQAAYEALRDERPIAIRLAYEEREQPQRTPAPARPRASSPASRFGLIGAGGFAMSKIVPGLVSAGLTPAIVASASGLSAESARQQFGFEAAVAGADEVIERDDLDLIVIATPHHLHAQLAGAALAAGHAVYVEKPLALHSEELQTLDEVIRMAPLFVGFNRRYAPLAIELKALDGPRLMSYRVNAGRLEPGHWVNDLERGGGRLKGEGCHFIDFLCDQAGADPVSVLASGFPSSAALPLASTDNFGLQIRFADGSVGNLTYAADAPTGPGKEHFETSSPGVFALLDDFKHASIWRGRKRQQLGGRRQDKGWTAQFELIARVLRGEAEAPPVEGYLVSTLATLAAARSLESGQVEQIVETEGADALVPAL
jgi:predicted dehydrogenase/threonine dehydrogenase-like Zn-dependent dehydrogenase